ncbi:MAG: 50S ribosomal protein L9 [Alphaproteobacteria bacterium]|nr:50S ribosomal protein L9 [Alphaproteobacteria bacterium]
MKVILQHDVVNVGSVGDVVNVADGYGRNFLIPRGLAVRADERNVRRLEHQKMVTAHKRQKMLSQANAKAELLATTAVSIKRQVGEEDRLFGSVTNRDIADALYEQHGVELDRRDIQLDEPIRQIGAFDVEIKLPMGVKASLKVYVIRE